MPELVQKASDEPRPEPAAANNLKDLLLKCILDAADIVKQSGIQFSNDELQKLATTLFIQRSR